LAINSSRYGFILRYTADKVAVTGYRAESWHYRYVGVELASELNKQGITTLEEFFGLPSAPSY
jgi:D-alanyl-D-alanine carboxypeptidase